MKCKLVILMLIFMLLPISAVAQQEVSALNKVYKG